MSKDKKIMEMAEVIEKHFRDNNHANCDVGFSYSEICFFKEDDIKGVAHSIARALYKADYRKQSDVVKEFAEELLKDDDMLTTNQRLNAVRNLAKKDSVEVK